MPHAAFVARRVERVRELRQAGASLAEIRTTLGMSDTTLAPRKMRCCCDRREQVSTPSATIASSAQLSWCRSNYIQTLFLLTHTRWCCLMQEMQSGACVARSNSAVPSAAAVESGCQVCTRGCRKKHLLCGC
jgi:hypothetical protein